MKRLCLGLFVVAVLALAAFPQSARADEIGISGASGSITFTSNGNGTLNFSTGGFATASPLATFQSPTGTPQDSGSASFGAMSGSTGTESGGVFSITSGGSETFTFTSTSDSDTLTGTVNWNGIKDNTTSPQFDVNSTLLVTAVAGDSTFTNDFQVGTSHQIDFTITGSTTLTALAGTAKGNTATYTFSSGEVSAVPEPGTLVLFGSGLISLAGLMRRKLLRA